MGLFTNPDGLNFLGFCLKSRSKSLAISRLSCRHSSHSAKFIQENSGMKNRRYRMSMTLRIVDSHWLPPLLSRRPLSPSLS
jgi:hypothetical protein